MLVVEDDRDFAESLVDLLQPHGFDVKTASNVPLPLEALSFSADIALIDGRLGADDGVPLVQPLRARPDLVCTLMTAYDGRVRRGGAGVALLRERRDEVVNGTAGSIGWRSRLDRV